MNPFTHLRTQIKSCLEKEARLSPSERKQHQWQFITTVNSVTYMVGKGGANTMFYSIGIEGKRHLCMPKEMLSIISSWVGSKYPMYAIGKKKGAYTHGPNPSIDTLLEEDPNTGSFIVGLTHEGKAIRLYRYEAGMMGNQWVKFTNTKARKT
jgi:hypothetical protein